ncbi:MAG: hypothetical protein ACYSWT_15350, partial [Planctomycetota bacterium]
MTAAGKGCGADRCVTASASDADAFAYDNGSVAEGSRVTAGDASTAPPSASAGTRCASVGAGEGTVIETAASAWALRAASEGNSIVSWSFCSRREAPARSTAAASGVTSARGIACPGAVSTGSVTSAARAGGMP